ncbi:unnamed protein product, partial [marine sediment metagenome]
MEVFVHRAPTATGYLTYELEGVVELEEMLNSSTLNKPLTDDEEVSVEITGRWGKIKPLLSGPAFADIWFN